MYQRTSHLMSTQNQLLRSLFGRFTANYSSLRNHLGFIKSISIRLVNNSDCGISGIFQKFDRIGNYCPTVATYRLESSGGVCASSNGPGWSNSFEESHAGKAFPIPHFVQFLDLAFCARFIPYVRGMASFRVESPHPGVPLVG